MVLEKKGLYLGTDILENYGIDSETDVSVLGQDDFSKLVSRGLKPLHAKKLDRWCDTVCACVDNMLSSSLNNPTTGTLLSSEALTTITLTAHSATVAESLSDNYNERDGEEEGDRSVGQKGQDHADRRTREICQKVPPCWGLGVWYFYEIVL